MLPIFLMKGKLMKKFFSLMLGLVLTGLFALSASAQTAADAPKPLDILFVGDSITDFWDNAGMPVFQKYYGFRRVLNIGVSGDVTEVTLNNRLEQDRVKNIDPKCIMLMIGTNDIGWKKLSAEEAIDGNKKILEKLRNKWPNAKILHLAVFPRDAKPDGPHRAKIAQINEAIAKMADNEHIFFMDINANFLDKDGNLPKEIMPDFLHPNAYGYELWAAAVEPTFKKWLGGVAVESIDRMNEKWWKDRFEANQNEFKNNEIGLVLLGDSIIHGWDRSGDRNELYHKSFDAFKPANWGFGADRTEHVLWRLDNIGEGKTAPKLFMVMIGTNNVGHGKSNPDQTVEGIRLIIEKINKSWPQAKVLLLGVFPRGANNEDGMRKQVNLINDRLGALCDGKNIVYLNIGPNFLDKDGNLSKDIMPDLLHPNLKGCQIWADSVLPTIEKMFGAL